MDAGVMGDSPNTPKKFRLAFEATVSMPLGSRPFVCEGSPYAQQAFIIGINATVGVGKFWDFWDDSYGMLKTERFLPAYVAEKGGKISPTRKRIEVLVSAGLRCLETNLYIQPTARARMV